MMNFEYCITYYTIFTIFSFITWITITSFISTITASLVAAYDLQNTIITKYKNASTEDIHPGLQKHVHDVLRIYKTINS